MRAWGERTFEEANLLNPAFLSILIWKSVEGYSDITLIGAPYSLPFLVLPLILHKQTRENFPRGIATTFVSWINQYPKGIYAKVGYAERARALMPYIREAIDFSLKSRILLINDNGFFSVDKIIKIKNKQQDFSKEVLDCFKKSYFCGRWLAKAGKIETIMAFLGVKP